MKLKPIEPGCKALIFGLVNYPEDNGKIVTVAEKFCMLDAWHCSGEIINNFGVKGESTYYSKNLMRIDGDDFQDEDNPYVIKDKEKIHG